MRQTQTTQDANRDGAGMIKKKIFIALFAATTTLTVWSGGVFAGVLNLLSWDGYIAPSTLEAFKRETGVDVVVHTILSDAELLDRLRKEPGKFDVANPADYMIPALLHDDLIDRFEPLRLNNFANLNDAWRVRAYDPRNLFSTPFHWGTTSFIVDGARYQGDIDTYKILFDPPPELRGEAGVLKGASALIKASLIFFGRPTCSVDPDHLAQVRAMLLTRFASATVLTASDALDRLSAPGLAVAVAWNGDAYRARGKRPALRYAYPREGVMVFSDALVIPKNAPNRAAALKFIDFMLRPEIAAMQTNFTGYANAVRGSDAFINSDLLDAPEVIVPTSVNISFQQYCDNDVQMIHDSLLEEILAILQSNRR